TYAGRIDVNGASAAEFSRKDWWKGSDVANLEDLKTAVDQGKSSLSAQANDNDMDAQFWGGQMQLQVDYHPVPTTPALVSPSEGSTLSRSSDTLLNWNTN